MCVYTIFKKHFLFIFHDITFLQSEYIAHVDKTLGELFDYDFAETLHDKHMHADLGGEYHAVNGEMKNYWLKDKTLVGPYKSPIANMSMGTVF